jgi:uncharacterized membrane protein HdeD (DUF308 family)/alpha-beta hydrolase superfamily lysophospholipase
LFCEHVVVRFPLMSGVKSFFATARPSLPRPVRVLFGAACVVAGVVLVTCPFTSLSVLVVLVGVTAIVTGVTRWTAAQRTVGRPDDLIAAGWIVLAVAVLAWPDLSVRSVALFVGVGMIVGGVADAAGVFRGSPDERLAAILEGVASVVFGLLALAWPDVTLLVVAIVFGARTVLFGLSELTKAVRASSAVEAHAVPPQRGGLRRWLSVGGTALALVVALMLGGVSAKLREGEPTVDAFYTAPDDVPAEPGALLRVERFTRAIPDDALAWRILYTTTRDEGVPATASALVVAPSDSSPSARPVVAWAHGTTGVDRRCAPSLLPEPLESGAFHALERVLDQSWVVVATDYIGLGTEGPHPYLVGQPSGRAVLDAVRAARQLDDLRLEEQTVVWGHSQGGGTALWTGQLAPTYAPDVNVVGVAALAPAADVAGLVDNLSETVGGSLFAAYAITGYAGTYPDVRFDDYVRPTARTVVRNLAARCLAEPAALVSILTAITTNMSAFHGDLRTGRLAERLAANEPAGPFEMPVLIGQGGADGIITPDNVAAYTQRLCDTGANVEFRRYEGRNHVGLVAADSPLLPELVTWTEQRLEAETARSSC